MRGRYLDKDNVGGQPIGAKISGGPEDFSLTDASYDLGNGSAKPLDDGQPPYGVDPTVAQVLRVVCGIDNADPGVVTPMWDGAITVYDMTNQKKIGWVSDTKLVPPYGHLTMQQLLALGKITSTTKLRINILANQDADAAQPDVALWKVRV
jgi:hypothetical protein